MAREAVVAVKAVVRRMWMGAGVRDSWWSRVRDFAQNWPPDYEGDAAHHLIERAIARSRVFLSVAMFVALYLDPEEPARFHAGVYAFSGCHLVYSLVVLWRVRSGLPPRAQINLFQAVDLVFPTAMIAAAAGPRSPFLALLAIGMLFASLRWGMSGAIRVAGIALLVIVLGGAMLHLGLWPVMDSGPLRHPGLLLFRGSYLVVTPLLIGYLVEGRRRIYAEHAVVGNFLRIARGGKDGVDSIERVFAELLRLYPAKRILLAVQDSLGERGWLWQFSALGHRELRSELKHLLPSDWPAYFGPRPGPVWQQAIDSGDPLGLRHPSQALVGCDVSVGTQFYGRVFLLDPDDLPLSRRRLRLLKMLAIQLAPPLLSEYLLSQLRRWTARDERARLALELHDGVMQSLCGLELEVESYRRSTTDAAENLRRFESIREQLHRSVLDLRGMMSRMQQSKVSPESLPVAIRQAAARFRRETGTDVLLRGIDGISAPNRRDAREIAALVQEALVNVRKHAKATRVVIEYRQQGGVAKLSIEDNGKGFPFSGSLSGDALEKYEHLPTVLSGRVNSIGGAMTLRSKPGEGALVEVIWPATEAEVSA